jgi:hypothetical protein
MKAIFKINNEWSVKSNSCNLILERTTLYKDPKKKTSKYVTNIVGYYGNLEAVYKAMVNEYVRDNPSILGELKTMVDLMNRLATDIMNNK